MEPPSKKAKYDQTWRNEYSRSTLFKDVIRSEKGPSMAFCKTCNTHFSIRASGRYDIKKHIGTQKHLCAQRAGSSSTLTSFVKKTEDYSVVNAEVLFTKFIIEKNLPLASFRFLATNQIFFRFRIVHFFSKSYTFWTSVVHFFMSKGWQLCIFEDKGKKLI